ncbi:MAG: hypothetical protein WEA82_08465 [Idiomarina sp.]
MVDQADIFQPLAQHSHYAELCTVLYERELAYLAQSVPTNAVTVRWFQARLRSLPYYIRRAARGMLATASPLQLDVQNGSWHAPQKKQLKVTPAQQTRTQKWLQGYAALGLVVPVIVATPIQQRVLLDSIDRIDTSAQRIHLNEWGWFSYSGESIHEADDEQNGLPEPTPGASITLVKPEKISLTAACCGHQWSHKGRTDPRTLSLREVLLAATLNWDNPSQVLRIPDQV